MSLAGAGIVGEGRLAHTFRLHVQVSLRVFRLRIFLFSGVFLSLAVSSAWAAETMIVWPSDWEVEALPHADASVQLRQRAVKADASGDPAMVVELTQTRLQPGHAVNVEGVLLEMRKAVQINFGRSGFQSVCTHMKASTLSEVPAMETTCTITQNGVHVMTQTLVAAASKETAWSLSYAGSKEGYAANKDEVLRIRESLRFNAAP